MEPTSVAPPPSLSGAGDRGGVVIAYAREGREVLGFVPAAVAIRFAALGAMIEVAGARPPARGIALADGEVVTVLALGDGSAAPPASRRDVHDAWQVPGADRALVCAASGQKVALTGGRAVATGVFARDLLGDGVIHGGRSAPLLDVRALYAEAERAIWAARAGSGEALGGGAR
ncbi:MAG: hypothetical protein U0359_26080 [Byssovorax sp.]